MKKLRVYFIIVLLLITSSCNSDRSLKIGYKTGIGQIFPAFTAFTIPSNKIVIEEPINIKFEYGHDFNEKSTASVYSEFDYSLEVILELFDNEKKVDKVTLYNDDLDDFINPNNKVLIDKNFIGSSNISFNQSFNLTINFNEYAYHQGRLLFRIRIYNNDPELPEEINRNQYRNSSIYFIQDGENIVFTSTNPLN
jgi:hypothetical protein